MKCFTLHWNYPFLECKNDNENQKYIKTVKTLISIKNEQDTQNSLMNDLLKILLKNCHRALITDGEHKGH